MYYVVSVGAYILIADKINNQTFNEVGVAPIVTKFSKKKKSYLNFFNVWEAASTVRCQLE